MINFEKLNLFQIKKGMKNETKSEKENFEERPFTFKITKKRSPWTPEEDEAITALVSKYGTGNWTLIANEMSNLYGFRNRSGKQCRERWHNHLDPHINKDYWTEKEENVLFMKHMEYGNKWSDIAKFLPGRTDNAIKNHFYSKLRKFIRKMLKQINKDNLLKSNGIDLNKYNSDRVYKMIKKNKIAYNSLSKEAILTMIINYERNNRNGKSELQMLKNKTNRKKTKSLPASVKENLYDEKINKRKNNFPQGNVSNYEDTLPAMATRTRSRSKILSRNLNDINNDYINYNNYNNFLTDASHNQVSLFNNITNITARSRGSKNENIYSMPRSRRNLRKRRIDQDYIYDEEDIQMAIKPENNMNEENGKELAKRNLNMIINKSVLFNNYVKEEEERRSSGIKSVEYTPNKLVQKDIFFPSAGFSQMSNPNIMPSTNSQSNFMYDDRMYRTCNNYESFPCIEQGYPLMSPLNPNSNIYPTSTRNYFNFDMLNEGSYQQPLTMQSYNIFRQPGQGFFSSSGFMTTPTNMGMTGMGLSPVQPQNLQHTPNKEITLHNKILINESDLIGMQKYNMARNNNYNWIETNKKEENTNQDMRIPRNNVNMPSTANSLIDYSEIQMLKIKPPMINKPFLDLAVINEDNTGNIFKQSLVRNVAEMQSSNIYGYTKMKVNSNMITNESSSMMMRNEELAGNIQDMNPQAIESDNALKQSAESNVNKKPESIGEFNVIPMKEGDRFNSEENENLESSSEINIETVSVTNTSEKSEDQKDSINDINSINEANINRLSLINMYSLSNVNRDNQINKPQIETTSTTQQLPQETKAILNISPKSAFSKMNKFK